METFYIIATKKSSTFPNSVEQIEKYRVYTGQKTSDGKYLGKDYTKAEFFSNHYSASRSYSSWNTKTDHKAELYKREITLGKPFLQSIGNSTNKDNLLELEDIR